jgi:hypothetical protein
VRFFWGEVPACCPGGWPSVLGVLKGLRPVMFLAAS